MRTHVTIAAMLSCLTPMVASAQSEEDVSGQEGPVEVAQPPAERGQPPPAAKGGRDSANVQHTVERGDTLWDLSQRFLGSPWYWPKVWSYNPEIANPHWIYPGNLVRFYGGGDEVPTQVEVGKVEAAEIDEGNLIGDDDRVLVTGQLGFRARSAVTLVTPGFVTPTEVEESGTIYGSFAESVMLTYPNQFYAHFKKGSPKVGETYVVFRPGRELFHPETNDSVGFYTKVLGEARVVRVEKDAEKRTIAVLDIVRQSEDMQRGDFIGPSAESLVRKVAARPADREVKGATVISGTTLYHYLHVENATIIIDRGSDQGVKPGFVFTIYRQNDGLPQDVVINPTRLQDDMPREDVGQCVAFEVKTRATVCMLSRSLREILRGDHAEIRVPQGARASRP